MGLQNPYQSDLYKRLLDYHKGLNGLQLQQQSAMKGSSQMAQSSSNLFSQMMQLQGLSGPTTRMLPRFEKGDRVWVDRKREAIWTVYRFEEGHYILVDENGNTARYDEDALQLARETAPEKAIVDFDTVVIADHKRQQILEALEQINQNDLIFKVWGFNETIEKGKGISLLFYGPPGTGKTLMAQAIAHKLKKKLSVISTADIESSAPGEAERNIRKHFAGAKDGKSMLLFDECDSLIYSRQNVGPILGAQINELLSQIERFDGITIFTTNRLGTLDEAVNRRLALKLEFDMPSHEERAEIWKRMFPKKAPIDDDVDWMRLAIVEITGGYIKNVVLRAARMAATEDIPNDKKRIHMKHLVRALQFETASMIDFENARDEQRSHIGHVDHTRGRGRTVQEGVDRGKF